ncbi:unnamed protein product, partial [Mesorhabditis belari]|uniref:Sodium/hydrogen exchanger n=1 Tax=Mesorhabditis belari TaxID=2138241 RepID=A0AAF3JAV8_9BILA
MKASYLKLTKPWLLDHYAHKRAEALHRLDTLILLTFISVLIVIVLTAWLFKHYRFRFVHESGLTLIYGLLIGFCIKYFDIGLWESTTIDVAPTNVTLQLREPPDYLRLEVKEKEQSQAQSVSFHYELIEGFYADKRKKDEQKIEQKTAFSPEIFFNILLPPIIFNAGYSLKKRNFFRNIGSILAFVFVGTTVSCLVTGILLFVLTKIFAMGFAFQELLVFGALISATDPVTVLSVFTEMRVEPDLFALVFGESALNDAVAIVLTNTIDSFSMSTETVDLNALLGAALNFLYVFFSSLLLGSIVGCLTALLTKLTHIADHSLLETSLFILFSYVSFLLAEVVQLTGIVAVLFCGICQAHYTFNNMSEESRATTKQFFHVISFLSESFIFCYIGVSVFVAGNQKWNLPFLFFAMIAIWIARAVFVYPLCAFLNLKRRPRIAKNYQHMIVFSGLRGAMAFALADRNTATENKQIICATTVAIVVMTVLFNGGLSNWMIEKLGIKHGDQIPNEYSLPRTDSAGEEREMIEPVTTPTSSGQNPWDKAFLPRKWYNFDANFMKPLLTHANPSLMDTMPPFTWPIAKFFTSDRQMAGGSL